MRKSIPVHTYPTPLAEAPRHSPISRNAAALLPLHPSAADEAKVHHAAPQLKPNLKPRLKPATLAFLLQNVAFLIMFSSWVLLTRYTELQPNFLALALMQGAIAMMLSGIMGMAVWWRFIQLMFPLAVLFMHGLSIPPWLYLAGFLLTLGLFWTTFRTQVPFFPSHEGVWQQVADYLPSSKPIRLMDIGSGLGDLLIAAALISLQQDSGSGQFPGGALSFADELEQLLSLFLGKIHDVFDGWHVWELLYWDQVQTIPAFKLYRNHAD